MKGIHKTTSALLILALMFSLAACSSKITEAPPLRDRGERLPVTTPNDTTDDTTDDITETTDETEDTTPEPPTNSYITDLVNEYESTKDSIAQQTLVIDGVAYYRTNIGFAILDLKDGIDGDEPCDETCDEDHEHVQGGSFAPIILGISYGTIYKRNIYGFDGNDFVMFDLQGNEVKRGVSPVGATEAYHIAENGKVMFDSKLLSADFQEVIDVTLTVDIGHGMTDGVTNYSLNAVYENKAFVAHGENRYIIDLDSLESQDTTYPNYQVEHLAGRFYGNNNRVIDMKTGGVLSANAVNKELFHVLCRTGEEYKTSGSNLMLGDEVILEGNAGSKYTLLDDEYFIVSDDVGTFLYRYLNDGTPVRQIDMG